MNRIIAVALLALAGCTTTASRLVSGAPFEVRHSTKSRAEISDCLLNRLSSNDTVPDRKTAQEVTTLAFNGPGIARHPAIYYFSIRDEGTGSVTEVHRYAKSSLAAAETCF